MAKFEKRLHALLLRRKGKSINVIAQELHVSKSTASVWCRDIVLTKKQRELLRINTIKAGHMGRIKGALMNKEKRLARIAYHKQQGIAYVQKLSERDIAMLGFGLYWGEGTKAEKSKLALVNSDPYVILLMFLWFQKVMGVGLGEFIPRVFINEIHRTREKIVLKFWSDLLGLPKSQFGNTVFLHVQNTKVYENHNSYYGVLHLQVRRSTDLKYKILGVIDAVKKDICRGSSVG